MENQNTPYYAILAFYDCKKKVVISLTALKDEDEVKDYVSSVSFDENDNFRGNRELTLEQYQRMSVRSSAVDMVNLVNDVGKTEPVFFLTGFVGNAHVCPEGLVFE
jgi:hypothetical protein